MVTEKPGADTRTALTAATILGLSAVILACAGPEPSVSGRDVLFTSSRGLKWPHYQIWRMESDGSNPRPVTRRDSVQDNFAVWSPDGRLIAFVSNRDAKDNHFRLYVMNADSSNVRAIGPRRRPIVVQPAWSPDGSMIVYAAGGGPDDMDLYVIDADGSEVRQLTSGPARERCPNWGPDGERILYTVDRGDTTQLMIRNLKSENAKPALPNEMEGECGYWSPDGRRIAFTAPPDFKLRPMVERLKDPGSVPQEIFVFNLRTDSVSQLTDGGGINLDPRWSPEARQLVFASRPTHDGQSAEEKGQLSSRRLEIYRINVDGTNRSRLTKNEVFDAHPSW